MRVQRASRRVMPYSPPPESDSMHRDTARDFRLELQQAHEKVEAAEWNELFNLIVRQGDVLVAKQSLDAADIYRKSVMKLLDLIVKDGLKLTTRRVSDMHGRQKIFAIVDEIDRDLLSLWESVISGQQRPLEMLKLVGEIKGLLISLKM